MGNTNAGGGVGGDGRGDGRGSSTKSRGSDRPYAIDLYGSLDRRGDSPRGDETRFDFANSSSSSSGTAPGRRRPVLCYQGSTDYGNEDTVEDYKVGLLSRFFIEPTFYPLFFPHPKQTESPQQLQPGNRRIQ